MVWKKVASSVIIQMILKINSNFFGTQKTVKAEFLPKFETWNNNNNILRQNKLKANI